MIKIAVLGNHDKLHISEYAKVFNDVKGVDSASNFWLTHIPIHPQEIFKRGNIHGHVHMGAATERLEDPRYFCVNWDFHRRAVNWEEIDEAVPK
jgi:hypothetical protein